MPPKSTNPKKAPKQQKGKGGWTGDGQVNCSFDNSIGNTGQPYSTDLSRILPSGPDNMSVPSAGNPATQINGAAQALLNHDTSGTSLPGNVVYPEHYSQFSEPLRTSAHAQQQTGTGENPAASHLGLGPRQLPSPNSRAFRRAANRHGSSVMQMLNGRGRGRRQQKGGQDPRLNRAMASVPAPIRAQLQMVQQQLARQSL